MEQHNIDSRFKQGLDNLNRQPSADAWARLQSRLNEPVVAPKPEIAEPEMKENKRILLWWHYAAAAVVLLFVSVGIFKNGSNLSGKTATEVAVNQSNETQAGNEKSIEVQTPVHKKAIIPENAIAKQKMPKTKPANVAENAIKMEVKSAVNTSPETQLAQLTSKPKKKRTVLVDPEKPILVESTPAQQEETLLATNTPAPASKTETPEVKPSGLAGMAIEVIVKKDNSENAVALQTPADTEKDSKLVSIFKQARNLKNGDKVDFQALGVTPDSKFAIGTRNLHQKVSKVLDI